MNKIRQSMLILPVAMLLVVFGGTAMAHGQDSSGTSGSDSTSTDSSTDQAVEQERSSLRTHIADTADEIGQNSGVSQHETENKFQNKADDILNELEHEGAHKHDAAEKQKNCTAAQKGLERKLSNLQSNSQKYLDRVNSVLDKTLTYQQTNNLNPTGLADLLAKANTAQTDATAAVANLNSLSVNLDCSSSTVTQNVAIFKAAAQDAHDKLLAYKMAVKNIVVALLQAKEGSQQ